MFRSNKARNKVGIVTGKLHHLVEYGDCMTECDSFKNPLRELYRITHHTVLAVWPVSYVCAQPNHQGRRQPWTAFLYLLGVISSMVYP